MGSKSRASHPADGRARERGDFRGLTKADGGTSRASSLGNSRIIAASTADRNADAPGTPSVRALRTAAAATRPVRAIFFLARGPTSGA
jgi:hypothetical protein